MSSTVPRILFITHPPYSSNEYEPWLKEHAFLGRVTEDWRLLSRPLLSLWNRWRCLKSAIVSESRSFLGRIRLLISIDIDRFSVPMASEYFPKSHPLYRTHTRNRNQCILDLRASRPTASLLDVALLLQGWDMGAKFLLCAENAAHDTRLTVDSITDSGNASK